LLYTGTEFANCVKHPIEEDRSSGGFAVRVNAGYQPLLTELDPFRVESLRDAVAEDQDDVAGIASAAFPRACSGLMYAAVPRISPTPVAAGEVKVGDSDRKLSVAWAAAAPAWTALARPKSSTLTVPSERTLMLAGFRSR
jgi:hypothetical protein